MDVKYLCNFHVIIRYYCQIIEKQFFAYEYIFIVIVKFFQIGNFTNLIKEKNFVILIS